jgi:hypothetical protein
MSTTLPAIFAICGTLTVFAAVACWRAWGLDIRGGKVVKPED